MRIAIEMQQLGADMESGTIVDWVKSVGDSVAKGDIIVEVETEKATVDMEALDAGTLIEIIHDAESEVPVGDVIGYLETGD